MLTIAKFDRYDLVNSPKSDRAAFTIWFSGCSFRCEDCYNVALWDKMSGIGYTVDELLTIITESCRQTGNTDIALLGGEPLEQESAELMKLLKCLHSRKYRVWLYTGFDFNQINTSILPYLYTIKCGRYDKTRKTPDGTIASSNQKFYRYGLINDKWDVITL